MAEEAAMIAKGKEKYLRKIKRIGGSRAYYECGKKGGIRVALCLKALKAVVPEEDWATEWEKKMAATATATYPVA